MADRVTGLGQTFGSWVGGGEAVTLTELHDRLAEDSKGNVEETRELGDVCVVHGDMHLAGYDDNPFCKLDVDGFCVLGSLLGIPSAYMRRLDLDMREANVAYWLEELREKEVTFVARDGYLVDVRGDEAVTVAEVVDVLSDVLHTDRWLVWGVERQTNATTVTVVVDEADVTVGDYPYHKGVRVVVPETLKALDVSPVLLSDQSCGVVEMVHPRGPVQVRNRTRDEVLGDIGQRVDSCAPLFDALPDAHSWCDGVADPGRRVTLQCREWGLPDRVSALAVNHARDFHAASGSVDYADLVALFSNLGWESVVKPMSRVKCERLAGHVLTEWGSEHRCPRCDNLET